MNPAQTRGALVAPLPLQSPNDIIKTSERGLLALARSIAGGDDVLADELTLAGRIGVWKAIQKFDPTRGIPLPKFAAAYVRGRMQNVLRAKKRFQRRHELFSEIEPPDGDDGGEADDRDPADRAVQMSIYADEFTQTADGISEFPEVVRFVEGLPPLLQLVVRRIYWEGHTQTSVANELGVSKMAVSKYMGTVRALGRLALQEVRNPVRAAA